MSPLRIRSNFAAPITLYGVNKKEIKFKKWLEPIQGEQTVTVPTKDIDRLEFEL